MLVSSKTPDGGNNGGSSAFTSSSSAAGGGNGLSLSPAQCGLVGAAIVATRTIPVLKFIDTRLTSGDALPSWWAADGVELRDPRLETAIDVDLRLCPVYGMAIRPALGLDAPFVPYAQFESVGYWEIGDADDGRLMLALMFGDEGVRAQLLSSSSSPQAGNLLIIDVIRAVFQPLVEMCRDKPFYAWGAAGESYRDFASLDDVIEWAESVQREGEENAGRSSELRTSAALSPRGQRELPDPLKALLQSAVGDEFEVMQRLGVGGFGAVYRARQVSLARDVAIKLIRPEYMDHPKARQLFAREARTVARLEHPHIIPINQFASEPLCWFAMRFVQGGDLQKEFESTGGGMELPRLLSILAPAASALDFAHANGVIHRDIKPGNILIDTTGWVLLSDFGIAKSNTEPNTTATGEAGGTYPFMAPEQIKGKPVAASDQYAVAQMTHLLLTGEGAIQAESGPEWIENHLHASPQISTALPRQVGEAIARGLAKNPTDRFPSVSEFVVALSASSEHDGRGAKLRGGGLTSSALATLGAAAEAPASRLARDSAKPVRARKRRANRRAPDAAPLVAEQSQIAPAQVWWLDHLAALSDPTVEKGAAVTASSRTGRHQQLWREVTEWLGGVCRTVLDRPGERWVNNPNQYQIGRLSYTYWGRLYPETDPELEDVFHIGVQLSKRLKWADPVETDLQAVATEPLIAVWASANDKLIERLGRPELRQLYGSLQHQALVARPELWRTGGALVRAGGKGALRTELMHPATYLAAVDRGEIPAACDLFSPLITASEVVADPSEAARRIAGFLTLLADPVRDARKAVRL